MEGGILNFEVTPNELAGIIEALHDGIIRRLKWSVYADDAHMKWRSLELVIVQEVIDNFISAYSKAVMLYREQGFKGADKFEEHFVFGDEIFDVLAGITTATTWDEVPMHPVHSPVSCKVCCAVFGS